MSGFKNFAIAGAGEIGSFIVHQFLQDKAAGKVNEVVVLTHQVGLSRVHDSGFG
jgi:saccharopine dehydrogenase-like NADP-dependent oxidoreductase